MRDIREVRVLSQHAYVTEYTHKSISSRSLITSIKIDLVIAQWVPHGAFVGPRGQDQSYGNINNMRVYLSLSLLVDGFDDTLGKQLF